MKKIESLNLKEITQNKDFFKSPEAWDEEIFYFLLVDRFNSDQEDYPLYDPEKDYENAIQNEEGKKQWMEAGDKWIGGSLKGISEKLDYLKGLGISVIWISPVLKQPSFSNNYHGYGIQNFLEVDPHFGSKEDLKELVDKAHSMGIYIILDVIINHSGDVFAYKSDDPAYNGQEYEVEAFRNGDGIADIDPQNPDYENSWPEGGVWPEELFKLSTFSRKGYITDWDNDPEYREGDFYSLKNINTGEGDIKNYQPSEALKILTECYKYWIAYADLDGFRLDTVKHINPGAVRYFVQELKEFAQTIGKKDFFIVGEITGGMEFAKHICEKTGLNAALGINKIPENLENVAKGYYPPENYFSIFTNIEELSEGKHQWYHKKVITMFDDHDMVYKQQHKERFCADKKTAPLIINAEFINFFTAGMPCIYYGTEQAFDGSGDNDKYIRESMFGGAFGAFRTKNRSFFNKDNPIYQEIKNFADIRNKYIHLRIGRQYLRKISDSYNPEFHIPTADQNRCNEIIAWSRVFSQEEFLLAVNCNLENEQSARILIDGTLHEPGDKFKCIYSADREEIGKEIEVIKTDQWNQHLKINIPAQGRIIYKSI
ncbi:alpha-amylase [Halanaerobium sp. Z-7514]|uniref:Alpha-amylase n=1 Tax=Halanaerobium polyolivorans TaxID=2886943 RepID=A0AAW4WXN7_9FIRM|nr:alpha-amylase family glycosyl hydrolase [Halanaerobium polyolivorans]MCC3144179.1 alpha-amylase [Halanaerobium polyolivorans]